MRRWFFMIHPLADQLDATDCRLTGVVGLPLRLYVENGNSSFHISKKTKTYQRQASPLSVKGKMLDLP